MTIRKDLFSVAGAVCLAGIMLASCQAVDGSYTDTVAPASVKSLTVGSCDSAVVLNWTDPTDKDLSSIVITCDGSETSVASGVQQYVYTGLTNGTTYTFYIYAKDSNGNLSNVQKISAAPRSGISSASITDAVAHPGDGSAAITWTLSYDTYAKVKVSGDAITTQYISCGTSRCALTGLTNDTSYTITLTPVDYADVTKEGTAVTVTVMPQEITETSADDWVLVYFKSESSYSSSSTAITQNSLYLATSTDGLNYTAVNSNAPVLTIDSTVGNGGQCIRDPYILRKNDGTFVLLATDWTPYSASKDTQYASATTSYWGTVSPCIIMADSDDLITWSNERAVPLVNLSTAILEKRYGTQMHMWAPEAFWDSTKQKYGVIWSGDGTLDGSDFVNRTYVSYTTDFETFEDPVLFYQYDVQEYDATKTVTEIDATMAKSGSTYYMFFKDESSSGKDIIAASSSSLDPQSFSMLNSGEYVTRTTIQGTAAYVEGPFVVKVGDVWWLFVDHYGSTSTTSTANFYGYSTSDLSLDPAVSGNWTKHANDGTYSFPAGVRHGNTVRVTSAELAALTSASW